MSDAAGGGARGGGGVSGEGGVHGSAAGGRRGGVSDDESAVNREQGRGVRCEYCSRYIYNWIIILIC